MSSGQLPAVLEHLRQWAAPESGNLSDAELLTRFSAGREETAFAALMRRHGRMVWGVCRHVLRHEQDAEDAFQATFLVLARKAGSIRKGTAVASWLHGTAYHIAARVRRNAAVRRRRESKGENLPAAGSVSEAAWREVLAILDEEVQRLPQKQRAAFVLCALEGKSLAESARQLGWKEGTLSGTLSRARESLRKRLARRGVTLSALLAGLALYRESAAPAALAERTLHAALALAAGQPAAGVLSASVSSLVCAANRSFAVTKLRLAALVLAAATIVTGVAGFARQKAEDKQNTEAGPPIRQAESAKPERGSRPRTDRFGDPLPPRAVARIGTVRWWFGRSHGLVYAPDGKSLVFRDNRGTVHFLDAATGKELRRIDIPNEGWQPCFALAPNGKTMATGSLHGSVIQIRDVRTGKELRRIEGDKRGTAALAFSPDGKSLVAGLHEDIRLWDTATGKETGRIAAKDIGFYNGIFFLPDGKTLISSGRISINWWDIATGREVRRIDRQKDGKPGGFYHFAVSPDGKRVTAIHRTDVLLLWDAATGNEIRRIELDSKFSPSSLCFSPDSQFLVCGSSDNGRGSWSHQTLFFAAATGQELRRWDEGDNHAHQMTFSPDGKILAQAMSGVLRLRDAKTGKPNLPALGLPNYVMGVRFSRDGKSLIAGCYGGQSGSWDPLTGEPLTPLRDPPEGFGRRADMLLGPALTAHGERAALVNAKGVLHVWEPATGKTCCRIAEPPVGEDHAEFSPDGKVIAVKHRDNFIRLWDARSGKLLRSLQHNSQARFPHPHAVSPDGRILAVDASAFPAKGMISLCETATGKEQSRLTWRDSTTTTCLVFSPDGKYLVAAHEQDAGRGMSGAGGQEDNALRLWDRDSGRELRRFPVPAGDIRALAISPDGRTVAAAVYDTLILWELASGAERGRFTGHREWIWSLAFSPNGRLLASGCLDYTACVWDVTGLCPDGKWTPRPAKPGELERLWADLGSKDGARAYRALWGLAATGPSSVAFLAQRLRPVPRGEDERLTRLLADLDSDRFETRERASQQLQRLGEQAEPALRKALAKKPSLEVGRRLRALLDRIESHTLSAQQLQELRAIEALEHIESEEAQALLRSLAAGAPADRMTREAKASLERRTTETKREP